MMLALIANANLFVLFMLLTTYAWGNPLLSEYNDIINSAVISPHQTVKQMSYKKILELMSKTLMFTTTHAKQIKSIRENLENFQKKSVSEQELLTYLGDKPIEFHKWLIAAIDKKIRLDSKDPNTIFGNPEVFSFKLYNQKIFELFEKQRSPLLKLSVLENIKIQKHLLSLKNQESAYKVWSLYDSGSQLFTVGDLKIENSWKSWFISNLEVAKAMLRETIIIGNPATIAIFANNLYKFSETSGNDVERARKLKEFYLDRAEFNAWLNNTFNDKAISSTSEAEMTSWGNVLLSHFTEAPLLEESCSAHLLN